VTCAPEDVVRTALETMKQARVRRLPVVGFGNTVTGILSMNDILRAASQGKKGVANEDIVETLQAICAHHHPAPHIVAA
jgi:CBS domain-containing protein